MTVPRGSASVRFTPVAPLTGEGLAGADTDPPARPSITGPEFRHSDSTVPRFRARPAVAVVANWSAGIVCAAVFLELLARALTSNLSLLDRPSPTASYSPNPAATEAAYKVLWCSEGCATTHFSRDGARLTQNPVLSDAATGVILGNSNMEAFQVSDGLITAAVVERLARAEGNRINVRQYGWSGVSVPVYVAIGPRILDAIHPAWVAVVLNRSDLGAPSLKGSRYWQAGLDQSGCMQVSELSDSDRLSSKTGVGSTAIRITRELMRKSTLTFLLVKKVQEIVESGQSPAWESGSASATDRESTQASVHALKDAFGGRLLIVYVPEINVQREPAHVAEETDLLAACAQEGVRCASMRDAMVRARATGHHMLTGFNNTEPGTGHLNAYGHDALARLIWDTLRTQP